MCYGRLELKLPDQLNDFLCKAPAADVAAGFDTKGVNNILPPDYLFFDTHTTITLRSDANNVAHKLKVFGIR